MVHFGLWVLLTYLPRSSNALRSFLRGCGRPTIQHLAQLGTVGQSCNSITVLFCFMNTSMLVSVSALHVWVETPL
jgi:hypothetical protein